MLSIIILSCFVLTTFGLPVEETNPELLGGGFEGDIILPPSFKNTRGAAINGQIYRWPYNVIPYDISNITNVKDRETITTAMNNLMYAVGTPIPGTEGRACCVYFRPATSNDTQVLNIRYGNGCSASIGYGRYLKTLNLKQSGCFYNGIIQHELLHVLGFFHEQSREDRDSYIQVNYNNINPNETHNFEKHQWGSRLENQGTPYDYGSIMHYSKTSFSVNNQPTIIPIQSNAVIGQREKLSPIDVLEVRRYYKCQNN